MYIKRKVSLEPTAHLMVEAEMKRRHIPYSTALNSILMSHGRAAGSSVIAARLAAKSVARKLHILSEKCPEVAGAAKLADQMVVWLENTAI